MPTTMSALMAQSEGGQIPSSLQVAQSFTGRDLEAASRSLDRSGVLPGCSGLPPEKLGTNGDQPSSSLCTLWDGRTKVRADFAVALTQLNQVYSARFGADLCLSSGYRTLAEQYATRAVNGGMAATPGKSEHGYGLAMDFCPATVRSGSERYNWLRANAPQYGIDNPNWARTQKLEPWHWEFTEPVLAHGGAN
jgi:hypothetical protein